MCAQFLSKEKPIIENIHYAVLDLCKCFWNLSGLCLLLLESCFSFRIVLFLYNSLDKLLFLPQLERVSNWNSCTHRLSLLWRFNRVKGVKWIVLLLGSRCLISMLSKIQLERWLILVVPYRCIASCLTQAIDLSDWVEEIRILLSWSCLRCLFVTLLNLSQL